MIRFFDMFSGIGGFRSGLEAVGGFICIGHCEIDRYANKAYTAIYDTGGELYFEDARKINASDLPKLDLICAGFPCQSFSVAGKRLGFRDTRGTLFFEIARIAAEKRPAFLLLENVPGLLSHDSGRTFDAILSALVEMGYHLEWWYAMPIALAYTANISESRSSEGGCTLSDIVMEGCGGQIFPLDNSDAAALIQLIPGPQGARVYETSGVACTQTAGVGGWGGKTGLYFIDMNSDPELTEYARCITARQDSGVGNHNGENSGVFIEDAPRAVLTPDKEKVRQQSRRIKEPNEAMFTITVQDRHGILHRDRVRKLMPIECWRLQGFTDEQFYKAQTVGLSDSRLYKMAGNAVSVPVISAIGERIKALDELYHITERKE